MDLYIYYRVPLAKASSLQQQAAAMQRQLTQQYGVDAALKRRPQETDGLHTWMEVYRDVPEAFEAILQDAVADHHLSRLIEGRRHTEYFLDCSPCV